nr:MAG TPA: hypothetical protein [Caudoviricetes sp.]
MKIVTFKLVYKWSKYAPNPENFQRYDVENKRAENIVNLKFTRSSARDYNTILARLKTELGLHINPAYVLICIDGSYDYLERWV